MIGYHFLRGDFRSGQGNEKPWTIGETRTLEGGAITPCTRGYHASPTAWDALAYARGSVLCRVELDGDLQAHGDPVDKYVARSRTLLAAVNVDRELRLFAADCAEHVLWLFEREYPQDDRPRKAIEAARDFANGKISAAAWASDVAWAAEWAAGSAAARAVASTIAWAVGRAVGRDAAWAAGSDVAWAAAWDAAWAAGSAVEWAAEWAVGRAVEWAIGRDAARDAEIQWQCERFDRSFGHIFDGVEAS